MNEQKNLKDLPNTSLVNQLDIISEEHDRIKKVIIESTLYLDQLEELYNNVYKVYKQRTDGPR